MLGASVASCTHSHPAPVSAPSPAAAPSAQISIAPGLTVEDAMRADLSDQEFGIIASGRENTQVLLQIAANTD
jgi:tRNA A37 threonylcarbamoyladenosine synthetase subunit TsaC/SUA5/YrdC